MERLRLAAVATLCSGLAAGIALCMNVVHYRTWAYVPAASFTRFQDASGAHTVPLAALVGLGSLALAVALARRGMPGIGGAPLWLAAACGAVPWVATPLYFLPLQARLAAAGPDATLVAQLVSGDLLLRTVPPIIQAAVHGWALARALRHVATSASTAALPGVMPATSARSA